MVTSFLKKMLNNNHFHKVSPPHLPFPPTLFPLPRTLPCTKTTIPTAPLPNGPLPSTPPMASSEALTDYERRRLDNIRRNHEMLASLSVRRKAADLAAAAAPRRSVPSRKPKLPSSPVIIRRSLRARGISPGSAPDAEPSSPTPSSPELPPPWKRSVIGIHDAYLGMPPGDGKLIETVLDMADAVPIPARKKLFVGETDGASGRVLMTLKPENMKRLLPGRVSSVVFFPFKDKTLIAAGDYHGHVAFWDVDRGDGDEAEGTYLYGPHSAQVSAIVMQPFNMAKIFTSSCDGIIRLMDVENETFNMVYTSDSAIYSASQQPEDAHSLYFGEGNGSLSIWDERAGKLASSWLLHDMRINTIDFNSRNSNLMATSSADRTVCIWDLRRVRHNKCNQKPNQLNVIRHKRPVHSAFFSHNGAALATTCLDDHISVIRGDEFNDILMIRHDNCSGKSMSTSRAIWGWDDAYLFVGSMKGAVDVISSTAGTSGTLGSKYMTSIPSRLAAHPFQRGSLACCTSGGQVYLWTSYF